MPPQLYVAGTPFDGRAYGSVTFICTSAPSSAWAIGSSPDGVAAYVPTQAVIFQTSPVSLSSSVSNTYSYSVPGGQFLQLSGGAGGTFQVSAAP